MTTIISLITIIFVLFIALINARLTIHKQNRELTQFKGFINESYRNFRHGISVAWLEIPTKFYKYIEESNTTPIDDFPY